MRILIIILVMVTLAAGAGGWYWISSTEPRIEFKTAEVKRGDLLSTIDSTGTVEPEEVVDVGAQVAGLVESFGKDANGKQIDYRSPVEADMVLARIDDAVYQADLHTAKAQLDQARASLKKGEADVKLAEAKRVQAEQNWDRAQKIGPSDALSQSDYDTYRSDFDAAVANVDVAAAEVAQANATIAEQQAALDKAQRNLAFCVIRSPVKGEIIDRRVNIGQTVVSSLNAPSLFLIAKDLTRMQVWVAVNEADIDRIRPGQTVTFTIDGIPEETFVGKVGKVRLNATMTSNVVTYTVEVDTDNSNRRMLPYMTANVQFDIHKETNALLVPNAALRWYPNNASDVVPAARGKWKPVEDDAPRSSDDEQVKKPKPTTRAKERHGTVWLKEGTKVRPVDVVLGPTDDMQTQISGEGIKESDRVVIGESAVESSAGDERDPFLPQMHKR